MALATDVRDYPDMEVVEERGRKFVLRFARDVFVLLSRKLEPPKREETGDARAPSTVEYFLILNEEAGEMLLKYVDMQFRQKLNRDAPKNYYFKTLFNDHNCLAFPNIRLEEGFVVTESVKLSDFQVTLIIWEKGDRGYLSLLDGCPYKGDSTRMLTGVEVVL
jgi:hypothetical protein